MMLQFNNSSLDKKSVKIGTVVVYARTSMCTYFTIALFTGLIPVGPQRGKTCLGVSERARLKPVSSAKETS